MTGPRSASGLPASPADAPRGNPGTLVADSGSSARGSEGCAGSLVVESATQTTTAGRPRLQTSRATGPPAGRPGHRQSCHRSSGLLPQVRGRKRRKSFSPIDREIGKTRPVDGEKGREGVAQEAGEVQGVQNVPEAPPQGLP